MVNIGYFTKHFRFVTHWIVKLNPLEALIYLKGYLNYGKVQILNVAIVRI